MNSVLRNRFVTLKLILLLAVLVSTGSLTACGKKGSLEKPGETTEQTGKKPKT